MSRSTLALKRLGVASVALVTIGAGLPTLLATSASANDATQVAISPSTQTAATGTCETFTVTVRNAAGATTSDTETVTVELRDPSPANNTVAGSTPSSTQNDDASAQFCTEDATGDSFTLGTDNSNTGVASADSSRRTITLQVVGGTATFGVVDSQQETVTLSPFLDEDGDAVFDVNADTRGANATAVFGPGNNNNTLAFSQAGNDAVESITEVAPAAGTTTVAGGSQVINVILANANGDPVAGAAPRAQVLSGGANSTGTTGNPTTGTREVTCTTSNNNGESTCTVPVPNAGTDTFLVYVQQTDGGTPGPDATEPQLRVTRTTTTAPNTNANEARFINLTPEGPVDTASGSSRTFTATVTDATGKAVQGVTVEFTRTGAGRFTAASGNSTNTTFVNDFFASAETNNLGQVTVTVSSAPGETGQAVVTSTITEGQINNNGQTTECDDAANSPSTGDATGNCSDAEVTNFVAGSASPSSSPSTPASPATPVSPRPTTSPSGPPPVPCTTPASISLERSTITATGSSGLTVRATANSIIDVFAYSRPSTTFRVVRSAELGADGTADFRITPPTNTRLYAQQRGCNASPSIVLNVRTALSLNVVRNGVRTYTFSGDSLPARPGGLIISLYRVTGSGSQILTSQVRASSTTGDWVIRRVFTGTGRFGFVVRTGQDLQNAPGASNVRSLLVF